MAARKKMSWKALAAYRTSGETVKAMGGKAIREVRDSEASSCLTFWATPKGTVITQIFTDTADVVFYQAFNPEGGVMKQAAPCKAFKLWRADNNPGKDTCETCGYERREHVAGYPYRVPIASIAREEGFRSTMAFLEDQSTKGMVRAACSEG